MSVKEQKIDILTSIDNEIVIKNKVFKYKVVKFGKNYITKFFKTEIKKTVEKDFLERDIVIGTHDLLFMVDFNITNMDQLEVENKMTKELKNNKKWKEIYLHEEE